MPRISLSTLLLVVALLLSAATARADVAPQFFDLPVGHPAAGGIAADGDGDIWLGTSSRSDAPELARLRVATSAVELYPTPKLSGVGCCANLVRSLAWEPSGRKVWFSQSDGIIGTVNPALTAPGTSGGFEAVLLETPLRGGGSFRPDIWDLAADPRGAGGPGRVWFTERNTSNVEPFPGARLAAMGNAVGIPSEYANLAVQGGSRSIDSLRYDAKPSGVAVGPDGTPWFAESDAGNPGWRLATPSSTTAYREFSLPCVPVGAPCSGSYTGTGVSDVTVGSDDALWFTNELRREIGRLSPDRGSFSGYRLIDIDPALAAGRPLAITTATDGSIWVAVRGGVSAGASAIVKLTPQTSEDGQPGVDVWRLGADRAPLALTDDRRGNIWFSTSAVSSATASGFGRLAGVVGGGGAVPNPGGGGSGTPGGGTPLGGGAAPAPPRSTVRAATASPPGRPTVSGDKATIDQICVGPPEDSCSLVYIISAHEYVTGFPNTRTDDRDRRGRALLATPSAVAAAKKKPKRRARRPRAVVLGQKYVTLRGGQRAKVIVTLNPAGRKLLRRAGRLTLFMTVTQRGASGAGRRIKAVKLTFRAKVRRAPAKKRR